jgi:choline dehydrogenase-like flavoprotein
MEDLLSSSLFGSGLAERRAAEGPSVDQVKVKKAEGQAAGVPQGGPAGEGVYDVVIVGSGFGGAVAACRLAQANQQLDDKRRVLLLERGRRYQAGAQDFPRVQIPEKLTNNPGLASSKRLPDVARLLWRNDHGLFDVQDLGMLRVVQSAGLGGGSLIYAAVHLRPPEEIFAKGWPEGYTRPALDPYYGLVEAMLDVSPVKEGAYPKTQRMEKVAAQLGRSGSFVRPPLAINLEELKDETNRFGVKQKACVGCGDCSIGCPHTAKNTLDHNYLADAERQGVEIRTLAEVVRLKRPVNGAHAGQDGVGRFEITYRDHVLGGLERKVTARYLFVCAGAVNTTELLLANRESLSPNWKDTGLSEVGRTFFANGDAPGVIFDTKEPWEPSSGPTITTALYHRARGGGWFLLQDGGIPPTMERALGFLRSPLWLGRNRFGGKQDGQANPVDARGFKRFDSGMPAGGVAAFLRGLPKIAKLHADHVPGTDASAPAGVLRFLPGDLRDLLQPWGDPSKVLADEIDGVVKNTLQGLKERWKRKWLKGFVLGLLTAADDRDLLASAADAIVARFPWLDMARLAPDLAAMSVSGLLALLLGPATDNNIAVLLAMGPDHAWIIERLPGRPTTARPADGQVANVDIYGSQERLMRDVAGALGGELRTNPGWTLGRRPVTVHAQGGCSMGPDDEHGVTDSSGEVRGCKNLFVLDGSVLPTSVGVNPSSTIAAIAERNIERFIQTQLRLDGWSARAAEDRRDADAGTPPADRFPVILARKQGTAKRVEEVLFSNGLPAERPATAKVPSLVWEEVMDGFVAPLDGGNPPTQWPIDQLDKAEFHRLEQRGQKDLRRLRAALKATVRDLDEALLTLNVRIEIEGSLTAWWPVEGRHLVRPTEYSGIKGTLQVDLTTRLLGSMRYDLRGQHRDGAVSLIGVKQLRDDPGVQAWRDLTTLHAIMTVGNQRYAGIIRVPLLDFVKTQLPSMSVKGDDIAVARKAYLTMRFMRHFQRGLANIYPLQGI